MHKFFKALTKCFICFLLIIFAWNCRIHLRSPSLVLLSSNLNVSCSGTSRNTLQLLHPQQLVVAFQSCTEFQRVVIEEELSREDFRRFFGLREVRFILSSNEPYDILIVNSHEALSNNPRTIGLVYNHTRTVYFRGDEISSTEQLKTVVLHEIGHWFGMDHICETETQRQNIGISPLSCDTNSVMNPNTSVNQLKHFGQSRQDTLELERSRVCFKTFN